MTDPTPPATHLLYIDTETTGLDPRHHDVIEVAWARRTGPVQALTMLHTLRNADPAALAINRYWDRRFHVHCTDDMLESGVAGQDRPALAELHRSLTGATIVAENYGFDLAHLLHKIGYAPWHYRPVELSSIAMTVFNLPRPEGMAKTAARLREWGWVIPEPDHTARGDVECLRACHEALTTISATIWDQAPARWYARGPVKASS